MLRACLRVLALVIILALLMTGLVPMALAEMRFGIPGVGEVICGFEVVDVQSSHMRGITFVYLEHLATGARVVYGACEDKNLGFCISFQTPPPNDKGIPHVFEHSTLSGSVKYPDPNMFFSIILQTFVTSANAFTNLNATSFPVSSLSEKQLSACADYILNGVFYPLVLSDERAMMREAYRYELTSPDAELTLNGTVYNEMRGYENASDTGGHHGMKRIFPGSPIGNNEGGDPALVPEISHQELCEFHEKYYHPSNSITALYGDMDIRPILAQLDEMFSPFERREYLDPWESEQELVGHVEESIRFPTTENTAETPLVQYYLPLKNATASEVNICRMICESMLEEDQPLGRKLKESLPHISASVSINDYDPHPLAIFQFSNARQEDASQLKALIQESFAELHNEGLDHEKLHNRYALWEYAVLDNNMNPGFGFDFVWMIVAIRDSFSNVDSFRQNYEAMYEIDSKIDAGEFERTLEKFLLAPDTSLLLSVLPDKGGAEREQAALEQELVDRKAAMTADEIDALVARTQDFAQWTEQNAMNSQIEQMIVVPVSELPDTLTHYAVTERKEGDMSVIEAELDLGELVEVQLVFDASSVPAKDLTAYALAAKLLLELPTQKSSTAELKARAAKSLYGLKFNVETRSYDNHTRYQPVFVVSFRTNRDDLADAFGLVEEILLSSNWQNEAELKSKLEVMIYNTRNAFIMEPDDLAMELMRAEGYAAGAYLYQVESIALYPYMKSLLTLKGEALNKELARIAGTLEGVLRQGSMCFNCVGSQELRQEAAKHAKQLYDKLPAGKGESVDYDSLLPKKPKNIAVGMDGGVLYNYQTLRLDREGIVNEKSGAHSMMAVIAGQSLLDQLRFQGGAYGASTSYNYPCFFFYSYRDPNLKESFECYEALGQQMREQPLTQEMLNGHISRYIAYQGTYYTPLSGAWCAVRDYPYGEDEIQKSEELMRELKTVTPEDVIALYDELDLLGAVGARSSVGDIQQIQANAELFDEINTMFLE